MFILCVFGLFLCLIKYCHERPFVADRFEMDKSHLLFKHPLDFPFLFWHRDNSVDCLNKIKQLAKVLLFALQIQFYGRWTNVSDIIGSGKELNLTDIAVTLCTTDEWITVGLELRTEHEPLSATRYLRLIGEHDDDDDNDTHSDQTSDDLPLMLAQPSVLRPLSLSLSGSHAIPVDLSLTLSLPLSIELIMFKLRIEFVVNFS